MLWRKTLNNYKNELRLTQKIIWGSKNEIGEYARNWFLGYTEKNR